MSVTGKGQDPLFLVVRELEELERTVAAAQAALSESPAVLARADPAGVLRRLGHVLASLGECLDQLDEVRFGTSLFKDQPSLPMEGADQQPS